MGEDWVRFEFIFITFQHVYNQLEITREQSCFGTWNANIRSPLTYVNLKRP